MCQICAEFRPELGDQCEYAQVYSHQPVTTVDGEVQSYGVRSYADFDGIADYIESGFWTSRGASTRDYSRDADGILTVHIGNLNAAGKQVARLALETWEDVSGLQFEIVQSANEAQLRFDDEQSGAYATTSYYPDTGEAVYSNINIHKSWISNYGAEAGGYAFQTYMHEIGHALGLGHSGDYNGSANFNTQRVYDNDSWQATVMSYFSQDENHFINASRAFTLTLMQADILAIQSIYGRATNTRTDDSTYGFNSTAGGSLADLGNLLRTSTATLYDDGGVDTLDLSQVADDQWIDLDPGAISSVAGRVGNLIIDRSTLLENAIGGSGNDIIWGNDADNVLTGAAGNDTLLGGEGNDSLIVEGADVLDGGAGTDTAIFSGAWEDYTLTADDGAGAGTLRHDGSGVSVDFQRVAYFTFSDVTVTYADLGNGTPVQPGDPTPPADPSDPVVTSDYTFLIEDKSLFLVSGGQRIQLFDSAGKELRSTKFEDWSFVSAVGTGEGIRVLFHNSAEGLYRDWLMSDEGVHQSGGDTYGAVALARIEALYGDVNGDNAIAQMPANPELIVIDGALLLSTEDGDLGLSDARGREIGDSAVRGWTALAAIETDSGYRVAFGDGQGHYQIWTLDPAAELLAADVTTGTVALARLEQEFGDLNGDNAIEAMPARPEIIALDGDLFVSTPQGDFALLDLRGRSVSERDIADCEVIGTLANAQGYRILLQDTDGDFADWQTDGTGQMLTAVETRGAVALARFEAAFGDLNGDGQIAAMPTDPELVIMDRVLQLSTRDGVLFISDDRGRALTDNTINGWSHVRAVEDGDGYRVLFRDAEDGLWRDMAVAADGTLLSDAVTTGTVALARLEAVYGDIDGSGSVEVMPADPEIIVLDRALVLSTAEGDLSITDERGRAIRDSVLRDLTVVKAIAEDDGYRVLLRDGDGQLTEWTLNGSGAVIADTAMAGAMALARLERAFGDIDGSGGINAMPGDPEVVVVDKNSVLSTEDGMIALTYSNGRAVRDKIYRDWTFVKAIEEQDGSYRILLRDNDDAGRFADWHVGADGQRDARKVVAGDVGIARLEQDYGDIDGDGLVNGVPERPEVVAIEGYLWISGADEVIGLRDASGRAIKDKFLDDWSFVSALEHNGGYRFVFRDGADHYAEWTVDANGRATDINIVKGAVAVAVLEQDFGDLDGDGGVADVPDAPELVTLEGGLYVSTPDGLTAITTLRGRHASDKLFRKNTFLDMIEEGDGYRMLIQTSDGIYDEWVLNARGTRIDAIKSTGAVALARLEAMYGDIDGNGVIAEMPDDPAVVSMNRKLYVSTPDVDVVLTDLNGRPVADRMLRDFDLLGAKAQDDGTVRILFEAENGMYYDWVVGADGQARSAELVYGDVALARLEAIHGDINGDDAVASMPANPELITVDRVVLLSTAEGLVSLLDDRGRAMRENALRDWEVATAQEDGDGGYTIVLRSLEDAGVLAEWHVAPSGQVDAVEVSAGQVALARLEAAFGDINGDGLQEAMPETAEVITLDRALYLSSEEGFDALLDGRGDQLTDRPLRNKTVEAVGEDGDVAHVLLHNGAEIWTEWTFGANGRMTSEELLRGDVALARLEAFYGDLDGDGVLAAVPDAPEAVAIAGELILSDALGQMAITRKSGKVMNSGEVNGMTQVDGASDADGFHLLWEVSDGVYEDWTLSADGQIESRRRYEAEELSQLSEHYGASEMETLGMEADGFEFASQEPLMAEGWDGLL